MAMFIEDKEKEQYLKEIFESTSQKEDSTDMLSDIDIEKLKELKLKFKLPEQTETHKISI